MNTERHTQAAEATKSARPTADLVLIPKQMRAEWLDVLGHDPALSFAAAKVAIVVGAHFNKFSGDTFITQETIAAILDRDLRTARRGLEELEERGYIVVQRRELGLRISDGRKAYGGRGVANVYFPALDRGRISAMNAGGRLRDRMEALLRRAIERKGQNRKEGTGALLSQEIGGQGCPPIEPQRRAKMETKEGERVLPTLNHPTDDNPAAVSAGAAQEAPAASAEEATTLSSSPPIALEPSPPATAASAAPARQEVSIELPHEFAAVLKQRLGDVSYRSWFGDVRMIGFDDLASMLMLSAPTRFVADWLRTRFDFYIIDAWNQSRRLSGAPHADKLEVRVIAK
jgi:hypothetical protein